MGCPNLTPEREAALIERYPHEGNPVLMAEFGLTKGQLAWFATSLALKKSTETRCRINRMARQLSQPGKPSLSQRIVATVAAAGEVGMDMPAICAAIPDELAARVSALVHVTTKRGLLIRHGDRGHSRWTSAGWQTKGRPPSRQSVLPPTVKVPPVRGPGHMAGDPIIPAHVQPIEGPTVPGPSQRLAECEPGLFSLLGPGRYVADAPAWIRVATGFAA